jgi:signal transduction histidine kinase
MTKNGKVVAKPKRPERSSAQQVSGSEPERARSISFATPSLSKTITLFLVQLPKTIGDVVRCAASEFFPTTRVIETSNVTEATRQVVSEGPQLLVMIGLDETEIALATQATDDANLPRWAVVVLGQNSFDLAESVSLEECRAPLLVRIFRSALWQHELLRENLQLRGDLKTIARRVRHDLLSPLNCIYLSCEILKEFLSAEAPAVQSQLGVIHRSLNEACQVLDRVSEVLKASADPLPLVDLDMGTVVDRVLGNLESEIQQNGALLKRPSQWPKVQGVEKWLEMIWWNLLINALRHGSPSPSIQLGWEPNHQAMRFWVVNQGPALPAGIEANLFRRFDQLHALPGHGLGLSLVQRLVSLQGGRCGYERRGQDASCFYFTLPSGPA